MPRAHISDDGIREAAREELGFGELRPGQLESVRAVLEGRDTLCVMSTGSGKTAIYELAGLLLDGPAIVVSPLISLQRDQVEAIGESAAMLNSAAGPRARAQALEEIRDGEVGFVLLAPEQLMREDVRAQLAAARPALFVVDEAHCVSEWGHDFHLLPARVRDLPRVGRTAAPDAVPGRISGLGRRRRPIRRRPGSGRRVALSDFSSCSAHIAQARVSRDRRRA